LVRFAASRAATLLAAAIAADLHPTFGLGGVLTGTWDSGWYLAVGSYIQALPSVTPAHLIAATGYFQSGGANQGAAPQQWGQHVQTTSSILLPGAETIGLFYLRVGDFLQPQYQQQDGGATFNTGSGTGLESNFGCVWVSE